MSRVKQRLVREQLDELVVWLETSGDERPDLFGSQDEYEWLLRLAAALGSLLGRHSLDEHGRCQWCARPRRGWRKLLPPWSSRAPCNVLDTTEFFTESDIATVWWQVFAHRGDATTLDEVRAWLTPESDQDSGEHHALLSDGRVRLRDDTLPNESYGLVRPYANVPTKPPRSEQRTALTEADTEVLPKINEP